METQAYFSNIRERIVELLGQARHRVIVAVAWLTDRELFDALIAAQRRGVDVALAVLDDRINRKSSIAWERLTAVGGKHYWIPQGTNRAGSLHHKFCLIDDETVINGSFNWTNRASNADENIVVIQGDPEFAQEFLAAFEQLLDKHGHEAPPQDIDRAKLLDRLALIAKLIDLGDYEDVPDQAKKIAVANSISEIAEIGNLLNQKDWVKSKAAITALIARGLAIAVYEDPHIPEWKWQVRVLEAQVLALQDELAEVERRMHLFDHQQNQAIGHLISEYLDLRRKVLFARQKNKPEAIDQSEATAAENMFKAYERARVEQSNSTQPKQLSAKEQDDLKSLYRKLAQRCHPDRFDDEDKAWATEMFKQLGSAHQNNDIETMRELKEAIERGPGSGHSASTLDTSEKLKARLARLQASIAELSTKLSQAINTSVWQVISQAPDLDGWLKEKAESLRQEIRAFREELETLEEGPAI